MLAIPKRQQVGHEEEKDFRSACRHSSRRPAAARGRDLERTSYVSFVRDGMQIGQSQIFGLFEAFERRIRKGSRAGMRERVDFERRRNLDRLPPIPA